MNKPTVKFTTVNGGVSSNTRKQIVAQTAPAVDYALSLGKVPFAYMEDKKVYVAHVANDELTGEPVFVTLTMKVTNVHPSMLAKRKSRSKKDTPVVNVPELY